MRKNIYIIIITALVSSLISIFVYWNIQRISENKNDDTPQKNGIVDIKEISYEIPKFRIASTGLQMDYITEEDIKNLKKYQISAVTSDNIYNHYHTYKGIKVKDILESKGITDYSSIIFKADGRLQIEYMKSEIDDNLFFVFEKDGIKYPENQQVALFNPTIYERFNLTNIRILEVNPVETSETQ